MPNIFGKTADDYQHLVDLKNYDKDRYRQLITRGWTGYGHNFNAINDSRYHQRLARGVGLRDQVAQGITWLQSNVEAMQSEIEEILYSDFRLYDYFPFNTNIPEGAEAYFYRVVGHYGEGKFIENFGTNAPSAGISAQQVSYNMSYGGIIPHWSENDLRVAQFTGIALDTETIDAGTKGAMSHIERVGLGTDTQQYFEGLLNIASVPITTQTDTWNSAGFTPQSVVDAVTYAILQIVSNTNQIFGGVIKETLALYCSLEVSNFLNTTYFSYGTGNNPSMQTVWQAIQNNNIWTQSTGREVEMRLVQELSTAGADLENRVILGYPTSSKVWEMGMSISPRVLRIETSPFYYQAPMEYKISGLNVKRPGGLLYIDNVYTQPA